MKILIVDDDQDLASIIQVMLEDEGYEVQLAKDGKEGYLTYLLGMPDLVITDICMPGKNGLELMENIRMHNPEMISIYMSGDITRYQTVLEQETKKYNTRVLRKPFFRVELLQLITELQEHSREKAHCT